MVSLATPTKFEFKSHSSSDDAQTLSKVRIEIVHFDGFTTRRFWIWTGSIERRAATKRSPLVANLGYALSGRLTVRTTDGIEKTIVAGDSYSLPREDDARVEGEQPFVALEMSSTDEFASVE